MSGAKRVDPQEAKRLVDEGWTYLDVRSVVEFEQGHPEGAYNVPLLDFVPGRGMTPNPDFLDEVRARFEAATTLVVGCKAGGRSARAAEMLLAAGFSSVVDMMGGYAGEFDEAGRPVCLGWLERGLPVATEALPGRSYKGR